MDALVFETVGWLTSRPNFVPNSLSTTVTFQLLKTQHPIHLLIITATPILTESLPEGGNTRGTEKQNSVFVNAVASVQERRQ